MNLKRPASRNNCETRGLLRSFLGWDAATSISCICHFAMLLASTRCSLVSPIHSSSATTLMEGSVDLTGRVWMKIHGGETRIQRRGHMDDMGPARRPSGCFDLFGATLVYRRQVFFPFSRRSLVVTHSSSDCSQPGGSTILVVTGSTSSQLMCCLLLALSFVLPFFQSRVFVLSPFGQSFLEFCSYLVPWTHVHEVSMS